MFDNLATKVDKTIRNIPDFPQPGIIFKDITPVLYDAVLFGETIEFFKNELLRITPEIDVVVGIESRGFIFGAPLALALQKSFVPVRKKGKLPYDVISVEYALEYGHSVLEMHTDAIQHGQKVVIIDDLLATGGTMSAATSLIEQLGGEVVANVVMVNLAFLGGQSKLGNTPLVSLLTY
jgi:adenine phosphoribosyltransferase